jgi:hypothetical protein
MSLLFSLKETDSCPPLVFDWSRIWKMFCIDNVHFCRTLPVQGFNTGSCFHGCDSQALSLGGWKKQKCKNISLLATENTFVNLVYSTNTSQELIFSDLFLVFLLSQFSSSFLFKRMSFIGFTCTRILFRCSFLPLSVLPLLLLLLCSTSELSNCPAIK